MEVYPFSSKLNLVLSLFQLTAALRNLADTNTSRDRLLNCRVLDGLCLVSDNYSADGEIILNVSRIFR